MAEDPVASRSHAANLSRRALLTGFASTPLAMAVGIVPNPSAWERALKAYSAARQSHEAFVGAVLQPAYARVAEALTRSPVGELVGAPPVNVSEMREQIDAAERPIFQCGGRLEILVMRATNPEHAHLRLVLARDLCISRTRARLMHQHNIFALEEQGNDLREVTFDALIDLLRTPALDAAGLLLKVRVSYEEIFRHEDHDALLGAVFADVERLFG